jgi:UDP-N-acetylmuramate dehydrogenase
MTVLSGTGLPCILKEALAASVGGLEFLAGIPGTLGGAIYGNAGAYGWSVGDVLETATVLQPGGGQKTVSREELGFGYRDSVLKSAGGIVLAATLLCSPGDSRESEMKIRDILEKRQAKHPPLGTACAGSYFKNSCAATGGLAAWPSATPRSTRTTAISSSIRGTPARPMSWPWPASSRNGS